MNGTAKAVLTAAGAAAALTYFLDPVTGRRRRAGLRDKGLHLWNMSSKFTDKAIKDAGNHARGLGAAAKAVFSRACVSDDILIARIRSRLGRLTSHPHAIEVIAEQGIVSLSGPVLSSEKACVVSGVRGVRGVRSVIERLEAHNEPGDVPALQGGRKREATDWEFMQTNWSPAFRASAGIMGGALVAYGFRQGGFRGALANAAGSGMLLRSIFNRDIKSIAGVGAECRAMEIQKTVNINAPLERVFEFWNQPRNFPRFMSHVEEVTDLGQGRSHWRIREWGGVPVEWDAEITHYAKNNMIAWRTAAGSVIDHSGRVDFRPNPNGSTQVNLRICYRPPAGAIGHTVASLLGADPKKLLSDDMVRLKSLLEDGKVTGRDRHSVTREELQPASI